MTDADPSPQRAAAPAPTAPSSPSGTAGSAGARGATVRDPFLDNARGILITLVVVGHTLECFESTAEMLGGTVYMAIYSFHMAAFIMISGFLSRSYRNEPRQVRRLLTSMLVPYLIFQMVHEVGKALLLGQDLQLQLILPAWTLWFLVALIGWRLLTPVLRQLRHPLVFAVAVAVIAPLDPDIGSELSVGRIAQMLPFFVLGLVATPEMLARVKAFRHRWLGGVVLLGVVGGAFVLHEDVSTSLFFLRSGYEEDRSLLLNLVLQVMVLAAGVIGSLAVLLVSPRGHSPLTVLGQRSLTVYLLHPVVLLPIRYAEQLPEWLHSWWGSLGLIALAVLLTALLGSRVVGRLTTWLTDPPIGHLLVKDPAAARSS